MTLPFISRARHDAEVKELRRQIEVLERVLAHADERVANLNEALRQERVKARQLKRSVKAL